MSKKEVTASTYRDGIKLANKAMKGDLRRNQAAIKSGRIPMEKVRSNAKDISVKLKDRYDYQESQINKNGSRRPSGGARSTPTSISPRPADS